MADSCGWWKGKPPAALRFLPMIVVGLAVAGGARAEGGCAAGPTAVAARNAQSLTHLAWSPLRRAEIGWAPYETLIAHELRVDCPGDAPGFAAALGRWQKAHGVPPSGVLDAATFSRLAALWESRRPFVAVSRAACPPPPPDDRLAVARPGETFGGKLIRLRAGALEAWRRMVAAARADLGAAAGDPRLLTIFSGYRAPADDDARCAAEGNCQGVARAACSAHRTGLALDLFLGAAPGQRPDSSDDANRAFLAHTAVYRWLVANAGRFGFVNYPFEPWHWEWTGEPP